MPELFVWYHAEASMEGVLRHWVEEIGQQLCVTCHLYVRHTKGQTTFMETYTDISETQQQCLQQAAVACALFEGIERHSELFQRLF